MDKLTAEQCQMVEDNLGLAYFVANKLIKTIDVEYEELLATCFEGLVKASKGFNADRGIKFSTYAVQAIRFWVLKQFVYNKPMPQIVYLEDLKTKKGIKHNWEELFSDNTDLTDLLDPNILTDQMINLIENSKQLTLMQKEVLLMFCHDQDLTQMEVADRVGCSQKHVFYIKKVARQKLKKKWFNVV